MSPTSAGILSTGTEILQGHYPDTNAQWLSARLTAMGVHVVRHLAAPDDAENIVSALQYLAATCDLIIMTGGLGPTEDDLTRQAICQVFGVELEEDPQAWQMIVDRFATRGVPPPPSNRAQALIPKNARTLYNKWGTAPGFVLEFPKAPRSENTAPESAVFAALPGPPSENRPMYEEYLEKEFARRFGEGLLSRITNLHTFGVSESALNECLRPLFQKTRGNPNRILALLASHSKVDIRFTLRGRNADELDKESEAFTADILGVIPAGSVYGKDDDTLEAIVLDLLRRQGRKVAFAESCTGGLISKRLTDLPGSSDVFQESWVTYSNTAKEKHLGVCSETLKAHGAVSPDTAREMALGALRESDADVAVSVTGIAGPSGGTPEKPVGLVWYGIAWKGDSGGEPAVRTLKSVTPFGRELTRMFASHRAFDLLRRYLTGLPLEMP